MTQAVSLNSHFCLLEQEDHQALLRFSFPAWQPRNSLQDVGCVKCGTHLIDLSSLRDGFLVPSVFLSLKTIVAYTLLFSVMQAGG